MVSFLLPFPASWNSCIVRDRLHLKDSCTQWRQNNYQHSLKLSSKLRAQSLWKVVKKIPSTLLSWVKCPLETIIGGWLFYLLPDPEYVGYFLESHQPTVASNAAKIWSGAAMLPKGTVNFAQASLRRARSGSSSYLWWHQMVLICNWRFTSVSNSNYSHHP